MSEVTYLDYQSTTPLAPEARRAMEPYLHEKFGNPHSSHRLGRETKAIVELSREQLVASLGVKGGNLWFTAGATEAANWAIKGMMAKARSKRNRIVTVASEHACVIHTARYCQALGYPLTILGVDNMGRVDLGAVEEALGDDVALVAVMLVNNEIGVVQPIAEIGALARAAGALMVCDAVQGFGRVDLPWEACDMIALSSHKVHGPKGIGALWHTDDAQPEPLLHGGGQEGGIRSGTLAPALCAGFGAAADLMNSRRAEDHAHVEALWSLALAKFGPDWVINGSRTERYHGNLSIRRDGLDASRLISDTRSVAFSAGSACASGSGSSSHVLRALGLPDEDARSSIRLGFGRYTQADELDEALGLILKAAAQQDSIAA